MKRIAATLAVLAGFAARAGEKPKLPVYVYAGTVVPVTVQVAAESMASTILVRAGVSIHTKLPNGYSGHLVAIEIVDKPERDRRSDEIGFAYTSDGV